MTQNSSSTLRLVLPCAGEKDLYQLADLLNVRVTEVMDRTPLLARLLPRLYSSRPSVLVRRVVRQRSVTGRSGGTQRSGACCGGSLDKGYEISRKSNRVTQIVAILLFFYFLRYLTHQTTSIFHTC